MLRMSRSTETPNKRRGKQVGDSGVRAAAWRRFGLLRLRLKRPDYWISREPPPSQCRNNPVTRAMIAGIGVLCCVSVAFAEPAKVNPLGDLPADVQVKITQLAKILSGAIQDGKLSDGQIKATVNSGDVSGMIRSLGPDAAQLLQVV